MDSPDAELREFLAAKVYGERNESEVMVLLESLCSGEGVEEPEPVRRAIVESSRSRVNRNRKLPNVEHGLTAGGSSV